MITKGSFHKGHIPWNKDKTGCYSEDWLKQNREFLLQMNCKGPLHPKYGKKISEEAKKKTSDGLKGIRRSEETKMKLSVSHKGKHQPQEIRQKIAITSKEHWKDPMYVKKIQASRHGKPNQAENKLMDLLNSLYPGEWRYAGDFSFTINGKCPDFVNCNGQKKIIELFGDYWHKGEDPKDRIGIFKCLGYETLILWERELRDINSLKLKISGFARS